jgi:polyhydroxyalkanoate synthase
MQNTPWNHVAARAAFEQLDRMRQWRGALFDAAGFAPVESEYRVVHEEPGLRLRRYGDEHTEGPAMLIVPAPIKRPYIWDLKPSVSVVRQCLEQGMRVYLAEWAAIGDDEEGFGLCDYGNRLLLACTERIEADCGETASVIAGHSLGGILAGAFCCLHPQRARALVLLEAPMHFDAATDRMTSAVHAAPDARAIAAAFGTVPGSFLNAASVSAAPDEFRWEPYRDFSMSIADRDAFATHMRVLRWTHDEFALPGRLFADVVEWLYRDDRLMRGTLDMEGQRIGPGQLRTPLLSVYDPRSAVVPPQSVIAFHEAAAGKPKKLLQYEGDVGVALQHVGVLVGRNAHAVIWPAVFEWLFELAILPRSRPVS